MKEITKIEFPVLQTKLIDTNKIIANDYNPNKVASPEMRLLELSIIRDGFTQPIVTFHDKTKDIYIVVDGFHRYTVGKKLKLPKLPIVVIDKPIEDRIASTIRHNRARGTHQIKNMSSIVLDLYKSGWRDDQIAKELGMEMDEVLKLKQITGLEEAFKNMEFSKSWEIFRKKINKKNIN